MTSPDIVAMLECMAAADPRFHPSAFWERFNARNLAQLDAEGFGEIKRTVARNYFTWIVGNDHEQFAAVEAMLDESERADARREPPSPQRDERITEEQWAELTIFTRMLWKVAARIDTLGLLARIEEPPEGNPFDIRLDGRMISQDLANSVIEFYAIRERFRPNLDDVVRVCELGAGYGRDAYVFLRAFPRCRYVVIDIPPALAIAQRYLQDVLPERRAFTFRCFDSADEVGEELAAAEIAFLLPHQSSALPDDWADLSINISSLHEMGRGQIESYLTMIDRVTAGYFYSKQWFVSVNSFDQLEIRHDEYPIPPRWRRCYLRPTPVQVSFFEALYEVPAGQLQGFDASLS